MPFHVQAEGQNRERYRLWFWTPACAGEQRM